VNTNDFIKKLQKLVKEDPVVGFLQVRSISYELPGGEDSTAVEHVQVEGSGVTTALVIR
jgi:hypothetical protein